jgi:hypothetical protein
MTLKHANGWVYWPLEEMLSPTAMAHVQFAIERYLGNMDEPLPGNAREELIDLENKIRACLQHIAAERKSKPLQLTTDEDLLS